MAGTDLAPLSKFNIFSSVYLYFKSIRQIVPIKEDDVSSKMHRSFTNFDDLDCNLKKIYGGLTSGSYQINGPFYFLCNDSYLPFYRIITISQINTISIKLFDDKILNDDFCMVGSNNPEEFLEKITRPMVHSTQQNFRDYFLSANQIKNFDFIKSFNNIRLSPGTTLVSVNKYEQVEFFKLEKEYTFKYETYIVTDIPVKICIQ